MCTVSVCLAALLSSIATGSPATAQPSTATRRAFSEYAARVELRILREYRGSRFVLLAADEAARERLRRGDLRTVSAKSLQVDVAVPIPGGQVQHWVGATFVPRTTLDDAIPRLQNYNNRKNYLPGIVDSRILTHEANDFQVYLRLRQKSVIPAIFDMTLRSHYLRLDSHRLIIESRSESIAEVARLDAPPGSHGRDRGLLWALNHYWRMVEQDGGVYIECEALVLSRPTPALLQWMAGPIVRHASQGMLGTTLAETMRIMTTPEPDFPGESSTLRDYNAKKENAGQ